MQTEQGEFPAEFAFADEDVGRLTVQAGARAGAGVLGVTGGAEWEAPGGEYTLALSGLLGPSDLGLIAAATRYGLLGEGSRVQLYAAYEPWRVSAAPLRAGVEAEWVAGPGRLTAAVRGGSGGIGGQVRYLVTLEPPPKRPPEKQPFGPWASQVCKHLVSLPGGFSRPKLASWG
ncbi:hypothetical protein ACFP81_03505 [Deinococcus lacus]|uniref:Uncharacterized protein n=1 Tax=Deinococcus lacus TaxID=392561 RepID=A0ABW1YB27_9DEIO